MSTPHQPPQPQPTQPKKPNTAAGLAILAVLALCCVGGIVVAVNSSGDDKGDATAAPATTTATASSQAPRALPTFPGGDVDKWVATMTANHKVVWLKSGDKEARLDGVEDRLRWAGEVRGARMSDPSFAAMSITNASRKLLEINCHAVRIPKTTSPTRQVAFLADCVTAAQVNGVNAAEVKTWVGKTLPAMLGQDDIPDAKMQAGPLALTLVGADDTVWIQVRISA